MNTYKGKERRQFLRYDFEKPLHFSIITSAKDKKGSKDLINAVSKNLSASGILFTTKEVPRISSLLLLDLDYRTANICHEIEKRALILNNKLFGKVVRIEDNDEGTCNVGVAFITKSDKLSEDLKKRHK